MSAARKYPNAHPFLKMLAAQMAQHAGDMQMARALWTTTYQSSQDKQIRGNAVAHLRPCRWKKMSRASRTPSLQYGQKTGELPPNMIAWSRRACSPEFPSIPTAIRTN